MGEDLYDICVCFKENIARPETGKSEAWKMFHGSQDQIRSDQNAVGKKQV